MGQVEDSGARPPVSGELNYRGRKLPVWLAPVQGQCVVRYGFLQCICGECEEPQEAPERLEDLPEKIPGWTVQMLRPTEDP